MDYKVTQEVISINEVVFEGSSEQAVDIEFTMPDYCPDIQRILKCQAVPVILSKQIGGDCLNIEGKIKIRLLYVDDSLKAIRCAEYSQPFSTSIKLNTIPECPVIKVKAIVAYMNCRAATSRKIDIHGAFTIFVKILGKTRDDVVVDAVGEGIQVKRKTLPVSSIIGSADRPFTVNEVLELGSGKPPAESIIRCHATAILTDYKAVMNKIVAKGELKLKILYCSDTDTGDMEIMEYSLPISQIIDVDGVSDDCICDVKFNVISCDVTTMADSNGENRLLEAEVKISATVDAYRSMEIKTVCDCYSTKYELNTDSRNISIERIAGMIDTDELFRTSIDLPEGGISKIFDLWCEEIGIKPEQNGKQLIMKIDMRLCLLGLDAQGLPVYFERNLDTEYVQDLGQEECNITCNPDFKIISVSFTISNDNKIELRIEFKICGCIYSACKTNAICTLEPNESAPKTNKKHGVLALYYADEGEDAWDIAKRYNTSMDSIIAENSLDPDTPIPKGMLMIPLIYK